MSEDKTITQEGNDTIEDMLNASGYDEEVLKATMEAERDVLGGAQTDAPCASIDAFSLANAVQGLNEAVSSLSIEQRSAYENAVRINSRLVEVETPAERFLRHANFDFWKAAQCLTDYWSKRREIYGEDRYCLPLRISNNGPTALSAAAITEIESAFFTICPPDKFNRAVILADRENLKEQDAPDIIATRAEWMFFWLHVLSESETAVSNGFVAIIAHHEAATAPNGNSSKKKPTGLFINLVQSGALPISIKAAHSATLKRASVAQYCAAMLLHVSFIQRSKFLGCRFRAHYCEEKAQLIKDLENYGLTTAHLPPRLGGTVDFRVWYEERLLNEKKQNEALMPDTKVLAKKDTESDQKKGERAKRKMEEFREWASNHLKKQRSVKLKVEVNLFQQEQENLKKHQALLQAQLACVKYLAEQYQDDRKQIIGLLTDFTSPLFTSQESNNLRGQDNDSFAESVFDTYLKLIGRSSTTGAWAFVAAPGLDAEKQSISIQLQQYLLGEQRRQKLKRKEVAEERNRSLQCLAQERDKKQDGDEEKGNVRLDEQIEALQRHGRALNDQQSRMTQQHSFLESSLSFATHLSDLFEDFRSKHRGLLVDTYICVLKVKGTSGKTDEDLRSSAITLADRVLDNSTNFVDGNVLNVAVTVVQSLDQSLVSQHVAASSQGTPPQELDKFMEKITSSLEDKPVAVDYLMSLSGETPAMGQASYFLQNASALLDARLLMQQETRLREQLQQQGRRRAEYRQKRKKLLKRL